MYVKRFLQRTNRISWFLPSRFGSVRPCSRHWFYIKLHHLWKPGWYWFFSARLSAHYLVVQLATSWLIRKRWIYMDIHTDSHMLIDLHQTGWSSGSIRKMVSDLRSLELQLLPKVFPPPHCSQTRDGYYAADSTRGSHNNCLTPLAAPTPPLHVAVPRSAPLGSAPWPWLCGGRLMMHDSQCRHSVKLSVRVRTNHHHRSCRSAADRDVGLAK